jgi:PAS domain S-box-containing protein
LTSVKKEEEMLNALFRYATEGIIISGSYGVIQMVNPVAEKQFGYSREELIGKKIEVLVPQRFSHGHVALREKFISEPSVRSMGKGRELFARRKDGTEFPVEISLSPFTTSEGNWIMSFIIDISGRRKREQELSKAHEEIKSLNQDLENRVKERTEELNRVIEKLAISQREVELALEKEKKLNELKSRFITTASHEFRTPLSTILSSVSLIGKYDAEADREKRVKHVERIKASVQNLTDILNDFLSVSKVEEGIIQNRPEKINLVAFATEAADSMRGMAGESINVVYQHKGGPEDFWIDPQLLKGIIFNLLSNAIKYSPPGKTVRLETDTTGNQLVLRVIDEGIGIPEEDLANLTERFFRAQNAGNIPGTGLGLNIVKRYLELMNSTLHFYSVLNRGTTVHVVVPNQMKNA